MPEQFVKYAEFYDLLYKDKNYKAEAEYISDLVNQYAGKTDLSLSVLDLACGTGKHAFYLEDLGFSVDGSDISSEMIKIAKDNAQKLGKKAKFYNYSFQDSFKIEKKYDVVISMFSAVNYLINYKELSKTLSNINQLLKNSGIFVFDYWNGNAVVRDYSPVKVLKKQDGDKKILRISETNLNLIEQSAKVKFSCMYFDGKEKMQEFVETHNLRYFYFDEMKTFLELNGFEIIYRGPFMKKDQELDDYEWNISIVARKK